jgi:hypothetical protein
MSPAIALAQEHEAIPVPAVELSAGYTFMRDFQDGPTSGHVDYPAGWYIAGAYNVNRWFGVVLESTRSYRNDLDYSFQDVSTSEDLRVETYLAGGRFFRQYGRLVPFVQVSAGAAHLRDRETVSGAYQYQGTRTATRFALQPGAGFTVYLTDRVGVRFSGDYRTIIDFEEENDYINEFRLLTGFTLHWGAR